MQIDAIEAWTMLLSETHFWTTLREEVRIKSHDLGAFRYLRQRDKDQEQQDLTCLAKRDYTERRNGLAVALYNLKCIPTILRSLIYKM